MLTEVKAYGFPAVPLSLAIEQEDAPFLVTDIQGIGPVKANINTTAISQYEILTGTSLPKRNIVIAVSLQPNWSLGQTQESLRDLLYSYFMPQSKIKLRFESTHMPSVEIEGVVEDCSPGLFSADPEYQLSIICPKSDFLGLTPKTIGGTANDVVSVDYAGSRPTGFLATIMAAPSHPAYSGPFRLSTSPPGNDFFWEGQLDSARIVELSSVPGKKFVRTRTPSTGNIVNLLSSLPNGMVWPYLVRGRNDIVVATAQAGQPWTLEYTERFGGL